VRGNGTYLITGGTGALGLTVAHALVARGARHLVLTSRRGLPDESAKRKVDALVALGATVRVVSADVSDGEAVAQLLSSLRHPLAGIVHAAGVLRDGLALNQTWESFAAVLAPKVLGALELAAHAQDVDFFVLFSSLSGWLGNAGQANYAAANAFLDGLADARGGRSLALAWGPWSGDGMAAGLAARSRQRGLAPFAAEEGAARFIELAGAAGKLEPSVALFKADFSQLARVSGRVPALLSELVTPVSSDVRRGELRQTLLSVPDGRRRALLMEQLEKGLREALALEQALAPERGFAELGLDSLAALEIKRQLESALDLSLPSTLLLDHPTLAALSDFLLRQLFPELTPNDVSASTAALTPLAPARQPAPDALEAEIEALDEAELLARIASKYDRWLSEE
jgi:acyl carrier protein